MGASKSIYIRQEKEPAMADQEAWVRRSRRRVTASAPAVASEWADGADVTVARCDSKEVRQLLAESKAREVRVKTERT